MDPLLPMLHRMAGRLLTDAQGQPAGEPVRRPQGTTMAMTAIHRLIEHHAAVRGDAIAVAHGGCELTYRELNQRANAVARCLIASGLHRGEHVLVRMDCSPELAIVLLAVLKTGGYYSWARSAAPGVTWPRGVSIVGELASEADARPVDVTRALDGREQPGPNLPVLARGSDIACVLQDPGGGPPVLIPHASIAAWQQGGAPEFARWAGEPGALDLWFVLMAGATASIGGEPARVAAA